MRQVSIIIIYQRTINIIYCAENGTSLVTKQGVIKKKIGISFNIGASKGFCSHSRDLSGFVSEIDFPFISHFYRFLRLFRDISTRILIIS